MQIDIHSHIIPGVDDGSPDMETSLAMLRQAAESGTTDIIATPHVIDVSTTLTWDIIKRHAETLQKEADAAGIPIRVYPGAETELNYDLLEMIRQDRSAFCLAGSRYLLMEMPSLMLPPHLDEMIYELQLLDIVPVLAHPERQMQLMEHPERLLALLKKGVLTQCNGNSLTGVFGPRVRHNLKKLLDNRMVCFMGSDAHNLRHRNTDLKEAAQMLAEGWGEERRQAILALRPKAILENRPPDAINFAADLPEQVTAAQHKKEEKKGFFAKLFG